MNSSTTRSSNQYNRKVHMTKTWNDKYSAAIINLTPF